MTVKTSDYICIREKQINKHSDEITELKARADFKEKRIEEISVKMEKIDEKLDVLDTKITDMMMKSVQDDNNLNQRVTSLENTVQVLKWVITLVFGSGILWIIINFMR